MSTPEEIAAKLAAIETEMRETFQSALDAIKTATHDELVSMRTFIMAYIVAEPDSPSSPELLAAIDAAIAAKQEVQN